MKYDLGTDPWGQIRSTLHLEDERGGKVSGGVSFRFDPQWQIDANTRARNDGSNGFTPSRELRKIAEIDVGTYQFIAAINGVPVHSHEHDEIVLRLLQSSEWRNLRTTDGGIPDRMVK